MKKFALKTQAGVIVVEATCDEAALLQASEDGLGPIHAIAPVEACHGQ